jgi:transketolase
MRNTFIATLEELAARNPRIWLLCGDLGFSVLERFADKFPDRYLNIGVSEQNMAGIAAGLGMSGNTVFTYSIGNFPTLRCLEQLRNDVCYHGADVKVVSVGGGYAYGSQGYSHHALEDVAIMSVLPGIEVFVPADPAEVREVVRYISESRRPAYLRLSRAGEPVLDPQPITDIRRVRPLREGSDVTILVSGPIASACLAAADRLAGDGIAARVVSVPCLKPLDRDGVLAALGGARLLVSVEEHVARGGLNRELAGILAERPAHPRLLALAVPETAAGKGCIAGDREALLAHAGLSPEHIETRIRDAWKACAG